MNSLSQRILGRSERAAPPVLWELTAPGDGAVLNFAGSLGANWFFIPCSVPIQEIGALASSLGAIERPAVILGASGDELIARTRRAEIERIEALWPVPCAAVMVQSADPSQMKSGGPFHRLGNLRQQGRCEFAFAEAQTLADAEWIISNSPAHAVSVPFGLADPSACFRLLDYGVELGTAILARAVEQPIWDVGASSGRRDLAFALSYPQVAMVIEPMPRSLDEARRALKAVANPMEPAERMEIESRFRAQIREPARPRGNHPPEFGS